MIFVAYIPKALGNLINATVTLPESVVRLRGTEFFITTVHVRTVWRMEYAFG